MYDIYINVALSKRSNNTLSKINSLSLFILGLVLQCFFFNNIEVNN